MAIRPIDGDELLGITRLLDTDAVRQSKTASWLLDQVLHDIQAMPTLTPPNKPLTLDQLREMDGQPVWVEFIGHPDGTPIEPLWMLVNCREKRLVTDVEYVDWNFEGWFAYSYPPAHIDRSGWISVKERLPKTGTVLVTDGKIVITAPSSSVTKDGLAITHWMPLPEPPEEGVNVNKENQYVELASHAIGLDHKKPYTRHGKKFYKPYRNYFSTAKGCSDYEYWDVMEASGYAKSRETERGGKFFWLTRSGLDWLGEHLGIHIYDEED